MCFFWKQFHLAWTRNICLKVVLVGWFIYIYRYDIINVTDSIQITLWANWMLFANLQLYVFFTLKIITVVWAITCILCVFLRWVVFNFQVNRIYIYIYIEIIGLSMNSWTMVKAVRCILARDRRCYHLRWLQPLGKWTWRSGCMFCKNGATSATRMAHSRNRRLVNDLISPFPKCR